jgi:hypothetical protein
VFHRCPRASERVHSPYDSPLAAVVVATLIVEGGVSEAGLLPSLNPPLLVNITVVDQECCQLLPWAEQAQNDIQKGCGGSMSYVLVRLKVADYARWKLIFDADSANRQAGGSKGGQLFRSADDPNDMIMILEWDQEQAHQFCQSEELKARMQEAGVLGSPDFFFLEEIEQLPR